MAARAGRPGGAAGAELPFIATIGLTNLIGLLNCRVGLFVVERVLGMAGAAMAASVVVLAWRFAQHAGLTWRDLLRIRFSAGGF